jgi:hypothetical protein
MEMRLDRGLMETRGGGLLPATTGARGGGRLATLGSSTRSMEWIAAVSCGAAAAGAGCQGGRRLQGAAERHARLPCQGAALARPWRALVLVRAAGAAAAASPPALPGWTWNQDAPSKLTIVAAPTTAEKGVPVTVALLESPVSVTVPSALQRGMEGWK